MKLKFYQKPLFRKFLLYPWFFVNFTMYILIKTSTSDLQLKTVLDVKDSIIPSIRISVHRHEKEYLSL